MCRVSFITINLALMRAWKEVGSAAFRETLLVQQNCSVVAIVQIRALLLETFSFNISTSQIGLKIRNVFKSHWPKMYVREQLKKSQNWVKAAIAFVCTTCKRQLLFALLQNITFVCTFAKDIFCLHFCNWKLILHYCNC